jgi:hypothetical protein
LVGIILSLALAVVVYRLLHAHQLDETAALFIGLPTILATALALTPKAKSPTGMIMKGITIALLMSGPVLKEGFVCIVLASPLFYLVGAIVGWAVGLARRRRDGVRVYSLVLLPLMLLSTEGLTPSLTLPRAISVRAEKLVLSSPEAVEAKLASTPDFTRPVPVLLMKFPRPTNSVGSGLSVGDTRTVFFARKTGAPTLVFVVAERAPGYVRFQAVSDNTKIGTWLRWQDAEVRWAAGPDGTAQVQWSLHFARQLSPAWYLPHWKLMGQQPRPDI